MNGLSRGELAALDVIRMQRQTTRAVVAAEIGMSVAMTARLVARLQEAGLVREAGRTAPAGRGRQALVLELEPRAAYVIGVDVGTEVIHLLVADLHGEPVFYREAASELLAGKSQPEIVAALAAQVRAAVAAAAIPAAQLAAIGVAVTGVIDSDRGLCLVRSNTPGWESFAIAADLGAELHLPVVLEETARAKALAELRRGAAQGARDFLFVDAGTAIGAGIVIDGQPLRGVNGLAGELGHVTVDPSGALCRCGNRGCIQANASARALVAQARELLYRGVFSSLSESAETLTMADVAAAAAAGDKMALGLLTEAGERLGEAISMALNLLGFDLVVLGGVLARCSPVVLEAAQRIVRLRVLPIIPLERRLMYGALGRDAAARGVVLQAIDWLFGAPAERLPRLVDGRPATAVAW